MIAVNEIETTGPAQREEQDSRIAETLTHILRSPRFKDSLQLQSLLRYVVDEAMKGNDDLLKERMIGIYVFGRRPDYDTTDDPIVRSRMGLLRKRLAQYYEGDAGDHAAVQIVIPNGTYRPAFTFRPRSRDARTKVDPIEVKPEALPLVQTEALPLVQTEALPLVLTEDTRSTPAASVTLVKETGITVPIQTARSTKRWILQLTALAAVLAVALFASWWFLSRPSQTTLDALWAPILKGKQPIYVYTGSMPVFEKESPADEATSTEDLYWPIRLPDPPTEDSPQTANFVLSYGEGMLTGSVYADIRVAALLSKYNRTPVLRSGANLPYMDLKGSPLILIGSFDNYWTRVINQDLPFYFDRGFGISERNGNHRRWHNPLKAEMTPRMMDDYALVFRVMDSKAGAPVLAIAGLSTCGTHAAADFVTDPAQMQALSGIPRAALKSKNIELVLHTSLVNCAPTSVQVIASKVW